MRQGNRRINCGSDDSSVSVGNDDPRYLGLICLAKKRRISFRILPDLRIQPWIFLKKRTPNQQDVPRCYNFSFVSNLIDLFGAKSESKNLLRGKIYLTTLVLAKVTVLLRKIL